MKEKIKEVQDYFKAKLLSNDFEVVKMTEYNLHLMIDNEYKFCIWVGNKDVPSSRRQYFSNSFEPENFININLSDDEVIQLHSILEPIVSDYYKNHLIQMKRQQFEALKRELNIE